MSAKIEQRKLIEDSILMLERIFSADMRTEQDEAELATFCAIAIELMKAATPFKLREAARTVELRYLIKEINDGK